MYEHEHDFDGIRFFTFFGLLIMTMFHLSRTKSGTAWWWSAK